MFFYHYFAGQGVRIDYQMGGLAYSIRLTFLFHFQSSKLNIDCACSVNDIAYPQFDQTHQLTINGRMNIKISETEVIEVVLLERAGQVSRVGIEAPKHYTVSRLDMEGRVIPRPPRTRLANV